MKLVTVAEMKNRLSEYLKRAESEAIIITRSGKPTAALYPLTTDDDLENYLLEHDPKFKIERHWRNYLKEGAIEISQLLKREKAK